MRELRVAVPPKSKLRTMLARVVSTQTIGGLPYATVTPDSSAAAAVGPLAVYYRSPLVGDRVPCFWLVESQQWVVYTGRTVLCDYPVPPTPPSLPDNFLDFSVTAPAYNRLDTFYLDTVQPGSGGFPIWVSKHTAVVGTPGMVDMSASNVRDNIGGSSTGWYMGATWHSTSFLFGDIGTWGLHPHGGYTTDLDSYNRCAPGTAMGSIGGRLRIPPEIQPIDPAIALPWARTVWGGSNFGTGGYSGSWTGQSGPGATLDSDTFMGFSEYDSLADLRVGQYYVTEGAPFSWDCFTYGRVPYMIARSQVPCPTSHDSYVLLLYAPSRSDWNNDPPAEPSALLTYDGYQIGGTGTMPWSYGTWHGRVFTLCADPSGTVYTLRVDRKPDQPYPLYDNPHEPPNESHYFYKLPGGAFYHEYWGYGYGYGPAAYHFYVWPGSTSFDLALSNPQTYINYVYGPNPTSTCTLYAFPPSHVWDGQVDPTFQVGAAASNFNQSGTILNPAGGWWTVVVFPNTLVDGPTPEDGSYTLYDLLLQDTKGGSSRFCSTPVHIDLPYTPWSDYLTLVSGVTVSATEVPPTVSYDAPTQAVTIGPGDASTPGPHVVLAGVPAGMTRLRAMFDAHVADGDSYLTLFGYAPGRWSGSLTYNGNYYGPVALVAADFVTMTTTRRRPIPAGDWDAILTMYAAPYNTPNARSVDINWHYDNASASGTAPQVFQITVGADWGYLEVFTDYVSGNYYGAYMNGYLYPPGAWTGNVATSTPIDYDLRSADIYLNAYSDPLFADNGALLSNAHLLTPGVWTVVIEPSDEPATWSQTFNILYDYQAGLRMTTFDIPAGGCGQVGMYYENGVTRWPGYPDVPQTYAEQDAQVYGPAGDSINQNPFNYPDPGTYVVLFWPASYGGQSTEFDFHACWWQS